ncbi:MAG: SDR family oxidoreductase [Gammaproteobacteria bacterium]|nr:SDR family oxidoreductase [Gammaproteobacteria bacterium]
MSNTTDALPLAGKMALITGGSGGIGTACARSFIEDGASVTLMGRGLESLIATRRSLEPALAEAATIELFAGDALDKADVVAAIDLAASIHGKLDICVPTVGGGSIRPLLMHNVESFQRELELNIISAFLVVRYAVKPMLAAGGGSIVCISSDAAKLVFPWLPAYSTAKSGLEGFVRAAAEELSRFRIRVNAVRPGLTRTEATASLFDDAATYQAFAAEKPLGRLGEPEDIAAGVRYLAGPESSWVTGQSFAIEGGNELRKAPDMAAMVEQIYGSEAYQAVLAGEAPFDVRDEDEWH